MNQEDIDTALRITEREQASVVLIKEARRTVKESEDLARSLIEQINASQNEVRNLVASVQVELGKIPAVLATDFRDELNRAMGASGERIQSSMTKSLATPIDEAMANLDRLKAKANAIELPSANKKMLSFVAAAVAIAVVFSGAAGFTAARVFPPKPTPEFTRQMQAGADLLRVWGDLPPSLRDDLIKRFSKR